MFCFPYPVETSNKCFRLFQSLDFSFAQINNLKSLSYNGKQYEEHPNSEFDHYKASIGNIENKIVAIAGQRGNQIEIFDIPSNKWTKQSDNTLCETFVCFL